MNFRLATHIENYSPFQMLYKGKKMTAICLEADYKFICGTNCLVENLLHFRPQLAVNPSNSALYENSILVGVGKESAYETFKNKYTTNLYKKILSDKYYHSVRDEATKHMLETIGKKAINTGCPTLWMFDEEKCSRIPKNKGNQVIFSVSGYSNQLDRKQDFKLINCLLQNYAKVYAWIQTTVDEGYLRSLIDLEKNNIELICSLSAFRKVLSKTTTDYIGTRLHGGVYALQHEARSIIVSIDERAAGFHESNNIPIINRNDIDSLSDMINSSFDTNITVNKEAIAMFINQFI